MTYETWKNTEQLFFGALLDRARESGIKVAVQNCGRNNFITSPHDWEIALGELPELWIKHDASHAYNREGGLPRPA